MLVFVLSSCLLIGCDNPQRSKLVGNWGIETADTIVRRLGADQQQTAKTETDANEKPDATAPSLPQMKIQFFRNGTFNTSTQIGRVTPTPKQGTWQMTGFDEVTNTMQVECKVGLQTTQHEIEWLDDQTIKLNPPNMAGLSMKLIFKRID